MQESEIEKYRTGFYKKWEEEEKELVDHFKKAVLETQKASFFLKEKYKAKQVFSFGSINKPDFFHAMSDIDLAVSGIDDTDYLHAVSDLIDLIPEFKVDLIRLEDVNHKFRKSILAEGKLL